MCDCFRSILEQKVYIVQPQNNKQKTKKGEKQQHKSSKQKQTN